MRIPWPIAALIVLCACSSGLSPDRLPVGNSTMAIPTPEATVVVYPHVVELDGKSVAFVVGSGQDAHLDNPQPLFLALQARADELREKAVGQGDAGAFRGALQLEVDRDQPGTLLAAVVNNVLRAGFSKPWLVVTDLGGERHGISLKGPTAATAAALTSVAVEAPNAGYANPVVILDGQQGYLVSARDRVIDDGKPLIVPCAPTPCRDWPDEDLNRLARRIKLDHPLDRGVLLTPSAGVTVQDVVLALDATRDDATTAAGGREIFPDAILAEASQ